VGIFLYDASRLTFEDSSKAGFENNQKLGRLEVAILTSLILPLVFLMRHNQHFNIGPIYTFRFARVSTI
jgi:hypothetical protein